MTISQTISERPQRWDEPFGQEMSQIAVDRLLQVAPFSEMDAAQFPDQLPLRGILKNDCRITEYQDGDIIIREGDYGSSAFLILEGQVNVSLISLPKRLLGRPESRRKSWAQIVSQLWGNSRVPEVRDYSKRSPSASPVAARLASDGQTRVFLQDIPRILSGDQMEAMGQGELFGEMAALTRSPRSATVFSRGRSVLVEIRWQGLRDLMRRCPAMRDHIWSQYREHSLNVHLRETALFQGLSDAAIEAVEKSIEFQTYGDFDWHHQFISSSKKDIAQQIDDEPLIAGEGEYAGGLLLIRNGFARVSRRYGDGHRTLAYLGKGDAFGLQEIAEGLGRTDAAATAVSRSVIDDATHPQIPHPIAWHFSLRAIGYVDVLRIPTSIVEQYILPHLDQESVARLSWLPQVFSTREGSRGKSTGENKRSVPELPEEGRATEMPHGDRLETMVQKRLINGLQAMLIDLDRCTRCDDCVRACADAHDGNPRFLRQGPVVGHHMVAHACMHCADPVCMIGCPTGAIGRDAESGVVNINDQTCIGCGTCANSCPYENIRMVEVFDRQQRQLVDQHQLPILKATKCDLCVEQNAGPACQHACPHDALVRINMREIDVLSQWLDR